MYGECLLCPLYPLLLEHNIWSNFSTRRKYCRYRVNVALLVILVSFFIQRLRKGFNIVISEQQIHAQQRKYAWYPGTGELAMLIHFRFSQWVSWTTDFSWLPFLVLKFTPLCKTVLQFGNSFFFFQPRYDCLQVDLDSLHPKDDMGCCVCLSQQWFSSQS